jgi:hypothetical protein
MTPALVSLLSVATRDPAVLAGLSYRLLADAHTPTEQNNLMRTVVSLVLLRGHLADAPPVPPLVTLEQVERARDRVADRITTLPADGAAPLPPPPVPGTDCIRPLTTAAALAAEGARMAHCIGDGGYARLAALGAGYGYAVRVRVGEAVHQGSVWIAPVPERPGRFVVEQLQGRRNTEPHPCVRAAVAAWEEAHVRAWEERARGRAPGERSSGASAPPPDAIWTRSAPWLPGVAPRAAGPWADDGIPF